jgi:uncharacterized protein involved in oxidation of intracellular sulfur
MKALFVLNDRPYGTERCYNGLRLARALSKNDPLAEITVLLMADAVAWPAIEAENMREGRQAQ